MQTHKTGFAKIVFFGGLATALILGIIASVPTRSNPGVVKHSTAGQIQQLDRKAAPYFDQAFRNAPRAAKELSRRKMLLKIFWVAAKDKMNGTDHLPYYLAREIQHSILEPCRRGAKAYGCDLDSMAFREAARSVTGDSAVSTLYAASGLVMDAIFLRSTVAAFQNVSAAILGRVALSGSAGAACAAADGPFPFGDAFGAALAIGGSALNVYDLLKASDRFEDEMRTALINSIKQCRQACRMAVLRRLSE